jgi:hypothetical protein
VTSWCNAASSPGASPDKSGVPPSLDVPSGNTLGSITHEATSARRRQIPRQPDSWLVITRILRPQHATGQEQRVPRPASGIVRRPPLTVSFFSRQSFTPHNHRRKSHHASVPPRLPPRRVRNGASSAAEMSSGVYPSRCRLQSRRLKWNLFAVRPLFHLTRRLLRRRRAIIVCFGQQTSSDIKKSN